MTRRHTGVPLGITALNGQACRNDMAIMRWGKWLMAVWFTADTHFGHAGALALYRRAFPSIAEMNAAMIARWNETVGPADDVWHLGDFALRTSAEAATTCCAG